MGRRVVALGLIDPWLAVAFLAGMPFVALVLRSFMRETSDVMLRRSALYRDLAGYWEGTAPGGGTLAAMSPARDKTAAAN